jgi:GNAT superfamily N-acetyltransferase
MRAYCDWFGGLTLKVVSVADGFESLFWNYVNRDLLDHYFFVLDWTQRREETKILLVVEDERVMGACLLYADVIVQLRGSRQAVKLLLDHVDLERVELQAPLDCEDIILTKYKPLVRYELVLMRLTRGEENIQITTVPVRLGPDDAADVVAIMRKADPEWWGELTEEMQRKSLETRFWLGIRQDGKLVSIGGTRLVDSGSNINAVATDEHYRSRGYATSTVSALVQEIFKHSQTALIHVVKGNAPAVCAYAKVGFRPYKHYLVMRAEKKKS